MASAGGMGFSAALRRSTSTSKSIGLHAGNVRVRIPPFDAVVLDLGLLWPEMEAGPLSEDEIG